MDKTLVSITYKTADGSEIGVEVSTPVKELLEQSDRQIRSQRRQERRHLDYAGFMEDLADTAMTAPQTDVADLLIRMESYERLYSALNKLSVVQYRRLRMYYIHGLTYRQIAELEGVYLSAVENSVKRAIIKLQKLLAD